MLGPTRPPRGKLSLDDAGRAKVFELNARRVYPRLPLPA